MSIRLYQTWICMTWHILCAYSQFTACSKPIYTKWSILGYNQVNIDQMVSIIVRLELWQLLNWLLVSLWPFSLTDIDIWKSEDGFLSLVTNSLEFLIRIQGQDLTKCCLCQQSDQSENSIDATDKSESSTGRWNIFDYFSPS